MEQTYLICQEEENEILIYIIFILLNVIDISFNNLINIDHDNDDNNNNIYFYDIKKM